MIIIIIIILLYYYYDVIDKINDSVINGPAAIVFLVGVPGVQNKLFEKIEVLELSETSENGVET